MSEPIRFRDGGGGELERLVLDSVRDEAPSRRTRRRVEAAIGLGAAISTTTATTSALGASVKTGVTAAVGKWIAVAAITAVAGAGAGVYLKHQEHRAPAHEAARPAPSAVPAAPSGLPLGPVAQAAASSPLPVTPAVPSVEPEPDPAPPTSAVAPAPSVRPAMTLGEQLRLLDEAHAALGAGDTTRALGLLDRYDREAGKPALAPEVMALRVEIYARRGDRTSAARLATQFLALYGDRPEAQRVRSILVAAQSDTNP